MLLAHVNPESQLLAVYLHPRFTVPLIGGAMANGYFSRRAPSWMSDTMFDRILNATLPNNLL